LDNSNALFLKNDLHIILFAELPKCQLINQTEMFVINANTVK